MDPAESKQICAPRRTQRQSLNLNGENDTSELTYESWSGVQKESVQYSYRGNSKLSDRDDVYEKLQRRSTHSPGRSPSTRLRPTSILVRSAWEPW